VRRSEPRARASLLTLWTRAVLLTMVSRRLMCYSTAKLYWNDNVRGYMESCWLSVEGYSGKRAENKTDDKSIL